MKFNTTRAADIRRFIDFNRLSSFAYDYSIDSEHNLDVDYVSTVTSVWIKNNKRKVRGLLNAYKNKPARFFHVMKTYDLAELNCSYRIMIFTNILCDAFDKFLMPVRKASKPKLYQITSYHFPENLSQISEPGPMFVDQIILGEENGEVILGCSLAAGSEDDAKQHLLELWPLTTKIMPIETVNEKLIPKPKNTEGAITGALINFSTVDDLIDEFIKLHVD
mgnify:FL=1